MGQALVREFFEYAGWAVSQTGLEGVARHVLDKDLDAGDLVSLPDLLVSKVADVDVSPGTKPLGQSFYVEVKTLRKWSPGDFARYAKWGHVLLVWVGPEGLRATWISKPGSERPRTAPVEESDFVPLPYVGVVSLVHCEDEACQSRTRRHFDDLGSKIAVLAADVN